MTMTKEDWILFHKTKQKKLEQWGKAVYLLDGNGQPICEIAEYTDLSAPQADGEISSLKMSIPVRNFHGHHPVVDELIADNLGQQDEEGRLSIVKRSTRMIYIEDADGMRFCYRITHCVASGGHDYPTQLEINGVDTVAVLSRLPAFSVRLSIKGEWKTLENDYGAKFKKNRDIQTFQVAKVADGFTKKGKADETIHLVIEQSLEALYKAFGITDENEKPYSVELEHSGIESPNVLIVLNDDDILSTVKKTAESAGVGIRSSFIFPYEEGTTITKPQIKFIVSQR